MANIHPWIGRSPLARPLSMPTMLIMKRIDVIGLLVTSTTATEPVAILDVTWAKISLRWYDLEVLFLKAMKYFLTENFKAFDNTSVMSEGSKDVWRRLVIEMVFIS